MINLVNLGVAGGLAVSTVCGATSVLVLIVRLVWVYGRHKWLCGVGMLCATRETLPHPP